MRTSLRLVCQMLAKSASMIQIRYTYPSMQQKIYEYIGWIGVTLVLGGYALVSMGVLSGNSAYYHIFMLVGSLFVAAISLKQRSYQPAVLNICFFVLAAFALLRLALQ